MEQEIRDTKGRFKRGVSGNPTGRPLSSKSARARLAMLEGEALRVLAERLSENDVTAATWVMGRLVPTLKPAAEAVVLPLKGDAATRAETIVQAAVSGRLAVDEAAGLLGALKAHADLSTVMEMRRELDELKEKLG